MRKFFKPIVLGVLTAMTVGCTSNKYTINGDIAGLEDQSVYLAQNVEGVMMDLDTVQATGGKFVFNGQLPSSDFLFVKFEKDPSTILIYADNSNISLKGTSDKITQDDIQVKGSKSHDFFESIRLQQKAMEEKMTAKRDSYMTAMQENNTEVMETIEKEAQEIQKEMAGEIAKILEKNPNHILTIYQLSSLLPLLDFDQIKAIYGKIDERIKNDPKAESFKKFFEARIKLEPGQPAPEFAITEVADTSAKFTQENLKGKNTLMFISIPNYPANEDFFNALRSLTFGDKADIITVILSYPGAEAEIQNYLQGAGIPDNWKSLAGNEAFANAFALSAPTIYFFDQEGKIVTQTTDPEKVTTEAAKLQ